MWTIPESVCVGFSVRVAAIRRSTYRIWEAYGGAPLIVTGPELEAALALVERFAKYQAAA